jgi:hypothetical protein
MIVTLPSLDGHAADGQCVLLYYTAHDTTCTVASESVWMKALRAEAVLEKCMSGRDPSVASVLVMLVMHHEPTNAVLAVTCHMSHVSRTTIRISVVFGNTVVEQSSIKA